MSKTKKVIFCVAILVQGIAIAATGGEHKASIYDLFWPAVNFSIIFGLLIWKLKKPISNFFNRYHEETKDLAEIAAVKMKDAEEQAKEVEEKIRDEEKRVKEIHEKSQGEAHDFGRLLKEETEEQIRRITHDANKKYNHERNALIRAMEEEFLLEVITEAREEIGKNKANQKKAASLILSELQ